MFFTVNRTDTYTLNSYALTVITNTNILHQLFEISSYFWFVSLQYFTNSNLLAYLKNFKYKIGNDLVYATPVVR